MRNLFAVVLLILLLSVGWYAYTTLPQQRDVLHALRIAEKVTVTEYRHGPRQGGYSDPLTQKVLSAPKRKELLRAFSTHGINGSPLSSEFDPHHRIDCLMQDSSVMTIHLCFGCGEYALDDGPHHSLGPWNDTLRETLPSLGIPVREASAYSSSSAP